MIFLKRSLAYNHYVFISRESSENSSTQNKNSLICDLEEPSEKYEKSNEIVSYNNLKKECVIRKYDSFNHVHIWEVIQSLMNENNKPGLRVEV